MAFGIKWLKPEIDEPIYYLHVLILAVVTLFLLKQFTGQDMLTIKNVLWSVPMITLGDVVAHTILKLD